MVGTDLDTGMGQDTDNGDSIRRNRFVADWFLAEAAAAAMKDVHGVVTTVMGAVVLIPSGCTQKFKIQCSKTFLSEMSWPVPTILAPITE